MALGPNRAPMDQGFVRTRIRKEAMSENCLGPHTWTIRNRRIEWNPDYPEIKFCILLDKTQAMRQMSESLDALETVSSFPSRDPLGVTQHCSLLRLVASEHRSQPCQGKDESRVSKHSGRTHENPGDEEIAKSSRMRVGHDQ